MKTNTNITYKEFKETDIFKSANIIEFTNAKGGSSFDDISDEALESMIVKDYRYSNGYGTLAKSKNEVITKIEAEKRLISHIKKTIYPKLEGVKFKSMQQLHASIDFAYNVGHNAFANNIVTESKEVDCVKMTEYINFNGKENNGLKKRRFENFIQCVSMEI